jgi:phosphoribosyl 1,2-cyclic phosphodiesterase
MQVTILGCRGSYPVAHPDLVTYGGDTTCIRVDAEDSLIILDAGTGIRKIHDLPPHVPEVHLFITHLHWDHILGFPQFPLLDSDITLHLYYLQRTSDDLQIALKNAMSQPLYPPRLAEQRATLRFHQLQPNDRVEIGDRIEITCALANHPCRALAYRVDHQGQSLVFVPDTAPFDRYLFDDEIVWQDTSLTASERTRLVERADRLIALAGDADWLIYDAAQTLDEYDQMPHWGHSTPEQAIAMAYQTGVDEVILFHHAPHRTDDMIDQMVEEQQQLHPDLRISAAYAGMQLF